MMDWVHILVVIFAVGIVFFLGSAARQLLFSTERGMLLFKALRWRLILSTMLFLFILLSYSLGYLQPRPAKFLLKLEAAQAKHRLHTNT